MLGLLLWEASFGAPILFLVSFGMAPCLFSAMTDSLPTSALRSIAFCSGEILGANIRTVKWQLDHGMKLDETEMTRYVTYEFAAMLLVVGTFLFVLFHVSPEPPEGEANDNMDSQDGSAEETGDGNSS